MNDNDLKKQIAEGVSKCRKAKGWTQSDLAERSGLAQNSISDLERGTARSQCRYPAAII